MQTEGKMIITGLPYGNPSRKMGRFFRFIYNKKTSHKHKIKSV